MQVDLEDPEAQVEPVVLVDLQMDRAEQVVEVDPEAQQDLVRV